MTRRFRLRTKVFLAFLSILILSNVTMFLVFDKGGWIIVPHDVDRKANGNTLIAWVTMGEVLNHLSRVKQQTTINPNTTLHKIIEVDANKNIVWQIQGMGIPHDIEELPSGHLLVADTARDRCVEINYPGIEVIWSWEPSKINWTKVNPEWNATHYYNNPLAYDWTHLNDVDFKQYSTWNACLISLRNFDLIVEVNYTAEIIGPANNWANIVWWYGDHGNYTLMRHQHNPDYLSNGNIIICDSENDRILEVNKTTKEVVWVLDEGLEWPRDADELDGTLLITDSFNNRVIEINKTTKEVIWSYWGDLIIPYEADLLENGNILISGANSGTVFEVNRNRKVVWRYGWSYPKAACYLNGILMVGISSIGLFYKYKQIRRLQPTGKQKIKKFISLGLYCALVVLGLFMIFGYNLFINFMTNIAYNVTRGGVL